MHIVTKAVNGSEYFYLVEKARENGRVVTRRQIYIGNRQKLAELVSQSASAGLPERYRSQSVGGALALATLAQELELEKVIDRACPSKHGSLPIGRPLLLAAIHRALVPRSANGLNKVAAFYEDSVLSEIMRVERPSMLNDRRLGKMYARLSPEDVDRIEEAVIEHVVEREKISTTALAFDCTNFDSYAAAKTPSRLLKLGHNKSGKPLRALGLGLLVNDEHIPLLTFAYPGNLNDVTAFKRFLKALDRRCESLKLPLDTTVAADGGNISKQMLLSLEKGRRYYVMRLPAKHLGEEHRRPTAELAALGGKLKGKVWAHKETRDVYGVQRCVVDVYSKRMHQRQLPGLQRDRKKARKELTYLQTQLEKQRQGKRRAKPLTEESIRRRAEAALSREHMASIFEATVALGTDGVPVLAFTERPEAWKHLETHVLGRTLLVTSRADWSPEQIVQASRVQSRNENLFKDLKDPEGVSMLPLRHRKDRCLRAHAFAVVLSLLLVRLLQRRLKAAGVAAPSARSVLEPLVSVSRARMTMAETAAPALKALAATTWIPAQRTERQTAILKALNLDSRPELGTTLANRLSSRSSEKRARRAA
jgi:transposase